MRIAPYPGKMNQETGFCWVFARILAGYERLKLRNRDDRHNRTEVVCESRQLLACEGRVLLERRRELNTGREDLTQSRKGAKKTKREWIKFVFERAESRSWHSLRDSLAALREIREAWSLAVTTVEVCGQAM